MGNPEFGKEAPDWEELANSSIGNVVGLQYFTAQE